MEGVILGMTSIEAVAAVIFFDRGRGTGTGTGPVVALPGAYDAALCRSRWAVRVWRRSHDPTLVHAIPPLKPCMHLTLRRLLPQGGQEKRPKRAKTEVV